MANATFSTLNLLPWVHVWLQKPSFFFKWRSHFYNQFFFFFLNFILVRSHIPTDPPESPQTNSFYPPSAQANTDDPVLLTSQYSTGKSTCFCSFLSPLSTWVGMPQVHLRNAAGIPNRVDWRTWTVQFTCSVKKANRDSHLQPSWVMHSFTKWFFSPKKH